MAKTVAKSETAQSKAERVLDRLEELYPGAKCALNFSTPFELLVATILSAQATDRMVNQVTEQLFRRANTPEAFAAMEGAELEGYIRRLGLFRNKARNIIAASREILVRHGGEVPRDREALQALPGVGRKTANVVLSNAFGEPAIAVDTHVFRVANRIGLAHARTPEQTEEQLMAVIPRERWSLAHHLLIHHGRNLCHARKPECARCPVLPDCGAGLRGAWEPGS